MFDTTTIAGPCGPFLIPATPHNTRERAQFVCEQVWSGAEYPIDALPDGIGSLVDIGAHCGSFAVLALKRWPSLSALYCYEPNALAAELADRNINAALHALGRNNVAVVVHAVAVTSDAAPRFSLPWDWAVARTYGVGEGGTAVASCHPRALPPADLVKCDGEGIEVDVLSHYLHWGALKALLLEIHYPGHKESIHTLCELQGLRRISGEDGPYGPSSWVR